MAALDEKLLKKESLLITKTLSQVERDTMHRCIHEVEREAHSKEEKGLNTMTFFLGVANCLFVAWSFGAIPEHFWLVYVFEVLVLFPVRFLHQATAKPLKEIPYWLDFCWVANFTGLAFLVTLILGKFGILHVGIDMRIAMFAASWGIGCGTLLLATAFLGNALIFHDADNVASVLIHLFPSLVLYTLRWCNKSVHAAWPEFRLDYFKLLTSTHIILCSMAVYGTWLLVYTLWLMCCGMGLPKRGYDTIFHANMRGSLGQLIYAKGRRLGQERYKKAAESNEFARLDALIYLFCHAVLCCLAMFTSLLCFHFQIWHASTCVAVTLRVIYNGAKRYHYYVIYLYTNKLKALLNSI